MGDVRLVVLERVADVRAGDLPGGVGERGGEHRQPGENPLRGCGQQVITPLDGAGQRLLPAGQAGHGAWALQLPTEEAEWSATNPGTRDPTRAPGCRQRAPGPSHGRAR